VGDGEGVEEEKEGHGLVFTLPKVPSRVAR